MNKELLANIRNILIPTLASRLKKTNYEGQGEKDAIEFTHDITEIFDLAEQQLSAQPGWIPVTERLPEEYGEYRITWTTSASKKRFVGDAEYEVTDEWDDKRNDFKSEWLLDDYIKAYPDVHVIAWKPLEEPYRPEGDDKYEG